MRTSKTVGTVAVVVLIGLAAVVSSIVGALGGQNPTTPGGQLPAVTAGTSGEAQPGGSVTDPDLIDRVPEVDYVLDLDTGAMTPLPLAIIRSGSEGERGLPRYAAARDGSRLAYVGTDDEENLQIFVARIDGSGIRQMTHNPIGAWSPAWSPDGTKIAYEGYGSEGVLNLFVLEVATGESTRIADARIADAGHLPRAQPQFTPDGSALLYSSSSPAVLRTIPIDGGKSTVLIGRDEGMGHAANGSLSPDGTLVTMMGNEIDGPGASRFVANVDGTGLRSIPQGGSNPAGTWSPDGKRIVCSDFSGKVILVVDVATGDALHVANGRAAIWLDRHTLLVEV
jgi:Tol biopolymer transport system component